MPDACWFRDRTETRLPSGALDGHRRALESEFTVTVVEEGDRCRLVASPVTIDDVDEWLRGRVGF